MERRRKYHWPEAQLNFWLIIFLAASATVLGIFAYFITVQQQLTVGIPWFVLYSGTNLCVLWANNGFQAVFVWRDGLRAGSPILHSHPRSHQSAAAPSWHRHHRIVHIIRTMVDRIDRNKHPTIRTQWKCERELSALCTGATVYWREPKYLGLAGAE